jgi:murein DD-endopeptidase MepM/ murein hydrolase activator NlpD
MTAWYNYQEWNNYGQQYSGILYPVNGDDIATPYNTPITALFSGTVVKQYYDPSGGTVIIQADNPGQLKGVQYYYYAHLDSTPVYAGVHVNAGQEIGRSGGQLQGGQHPASAAYSTGPHIMIGESHTSGIPYTPDTLTPELNPHWMIDYARGSASASNTGLTSLTGIFPSAACQCPAGSTPYWDTKRWTCRNAQGQSVPCSNDTQVNANADFLSALSDLVPWIGKPVRIIKLVFGILLIGSAIFLLVNPTSQFAGQISKAIKEAVPHPAKNYRRGAKG